MSPRGWNPAPRTLHFLWDLGGGLFGQIERPLKADGLERVTALADELERLESPEGSREVHDLKPMSWVREGYEISRDVVYNLPEGSIPGPVYLALSQSVCARRVTLAGHRLAGLLNRLLK